MKLNLSLKEGLFYFFIVGYLILNILSHLLGIGDQITYLESGLAMMQLGTALCFAALLLLPLFEDSRYYALTLILVAAFNGLQILDSAFGMELWPETFLPKSSAATSFLFLMIVFIEFLCLYEVWRPIRIGLKTVLYIVSGCILALYLEDARYLYAIPMFETVSWNTAVYFMLISILLIARFQNRALFKRKSGKEVYFKTLLSEGLYQYIIIFPLLVLVTFFVLSQLRIAELSAMFVLSVMLLCFIPFLVSYAQQLELWSWKKMENRVQVVLRKQNDRLNKNNRELRMEAELRNEFARITSHNLRGPAIAFCNLVELLKQDLPNEEKLKIVNMIEQRASANMKTIDDLAEFHNMISEQKLKHETCDVRQVFDEVFDTCLGQYLCEAELDFNLYGASKIEYPRVYLHSICYNLVSNAFKYRKPETKLLLNVNIKSNEHQMKIEVQDNGLGMDMNMFGRKIFKYGKSYHNFDNSRGLGLFMTKSQLIRMGDDISVESELGEGTTFKLTLNLIQKT